MIADIIRWSRGKNAFVRLPFLLWFGWVWIRHLRDPMYNSVLGALNLGIHEFGHLLFSPVGMFMSIVGATITQLLAPVYGIYNFLKQKDYFSAALCLGWLSTSCYHIAPYASDARSMDLPLVSPFGGAVYHDWNYMLSQMNILSRDHLIGSFFRSCGALFMGICLLAGGWMIVLMLTSQAPMTNRKIGNCP
jgi:hypothetical protein